MRLILGIDTGGTCTDAVVMNGAATDVVASAKVATTHHDLVIGIGDAVAAVLERAAVDGSAIGLVSLSTTLATNALVEGRGEPACLVLAGFGEGERRRVAIDDERHRVEIVPGGHDATGRELAPLDPSALARVVETTADRISAYAVACQFSVRNPAHELAIAAFLTETSGLPVTCSHELSSRLDGPRRASTAVLNASLIALIARLERSVEAAMARLSVTAPVMVVRGDGSLVAADFVARRPIETILSGPAASVVGARHLVHGGDGGAGDGLVVDVGGTTTDIAALRNGRPTITTDGAEIGGHRTMIDAVEGITHGLGGDSEVRVDPDVEGSLALGPSRAVPLSRLAAERPEVVDQLRAELGEAGPSSGRGRWLLPVPTVGQSAAEPSGRERAVLAALATGPAAEGDVAPSGPALRAVARLRRRGLVQVAAMTPTDAAIVLGRLAVDTEAQADAARLGAELLARQRDRFGRPLGAGAEEVAAQVEDRFVSLSAERVLDAGLRADGLGGVAGEPGASDPIVRAGLAGHRGIVGISVGLVAPIISVGASAGTYYGRVAAILGTEAVVPEHAAVANAIGAAVAPVRISRRATVTRPRSGTYLVHGAVLDGDAADGEPVVCRTADEARTRGGELLSATVRALAAQAGAASVEVSLEWEAATAAVAGRELLVEATITATATGRPRLA